MPADRVIHAEAIFGRDHREDVLTDAGAAERFARRHGADLRYDHRRSQWLLWQGHRWVPDADQAVVRLALDFARAWQHEAIEIPDRDKREVAIKFALQLERRGELIQMLVLARALKPIADPGDQWNHDPWLLATPAGVVDLRAGTVRPGKREDRITLSTAVPFATQAGCPRWEQFIWEVVAGDAELAAFIQRAVGYTLAGVATEQVLFLLHGVGSNGKGTFANTLKRVLGDYAWNMPFATIERRDRAAIPNDLARSSTAGSSPRPRPTTAAGSTRPGSRRSRAATR